jgi:hypothetical protein
VVTRAIADADAASKLDGEVTAIMSEPDVGWVDDSVV